MFDIKAALATFIAVFLAEVGDKTQLITMAISASNPSRLSVFAGASCALLCSSLLGVTIGHFLGDMLSQRLLARCGGVIFIGCGCLAIWRSFSMES